MVFLKRRFKYFFIYIGLMLICISLCSNYENYHQIVYTIPLSFFHFVLTIAVSLTEVYFLIDTIKDDMKIQTMILTRLTWKEYEKVMIQRIGLTIMILYLSQIIIPFLFYGFCDMKIITFFSIVLSVVSISAFLMDMYFLNHYAILIIFIIQIFMKFLFS